MAGSLNVSQLPSFISAVMLRPVGVIISHHTTGIRLSAVFSIHELDFLMLDYRLQ